MRSTFAPEPLQVMLFRYHGLCDYAEICQQIYMFQVTVMADVGGVRSCNGELASLRCSPSRRQRRTRRRVGVSHFTV